MREIITEIEINASAEKVWIQLVNLEKFSKWNPFIREAHGVIKEGARLKIKIVPPGGKAMVFNPVVKKVIPEVEFRWLGRFLLPGLFDGEHIFKLIPIAVQKTRLVHREKFSGMLVPFFWKSLDSGTRAGFKEMNNALKNLAEN